MTYRIMPLARIKPEVKYRLVTQPSTSWARNRGVVTAKNEGKSYLLNKERGNHSELYEIEHYGKIWGLQEIK